MIDYIVTTLNFRGNEYYAAALAEDMRLEELLLKEKGTEDLVGSVFKGVVDSVSLNIGGAFVDIGLPTLCFLPLTRHAHLSPSQSVLVQIQKDASGRKEPVLTTDISVGGRYAVIYSREGENAFSKKLTEEQKTICRAWLTDEEHPFRILVRTNAARCDKASFLEEVKRLELLMEEILARYKRAKKGEKLYEEEPFYVQLYRDFYKKVDRCFTDIPAFAPPLARLTRENTQAGDHASDGNYAQAGDHASDGNYAQAGDPSPDAEEICRPRAGRGLTLNELYDLPRALEKLVRKEVYLKSGAYLVIERTEAFVVIDVNSGKCRKGRIPEETYRKVNLEAAEEISRQMRLRNLSGTILVDFINLESEDHRTELIQVMKKLVRKDHIRTEVVDLTKLGIMEILRQKVRKPLAETLHI